MPTTILATQHSFDEMLEHMERRLMTDDTQATHTTPLRPSAKYFLRYANGNSGDFPAAPLDSDDRPARPYTNADMDDAPPGSRRDTYLTWLYRREQAELWIRDNTTVYGTPIADTDAYEKMQAAHAAYQADLAKQLGEAVQPGQVIISPATVDWWWLKYSLLQWRGTFYRPHPLTQVPYAVFEQIQYWYLLPPPYPPKDDDALRPGEMTHPIGDHPDTKAPRPSSLPFVPPVFAGGSAFVSSSHAARGALKAIYHRPTAETPVGEDGPWTTWPSGVPYCPVPSRSGASGATVYLRYGDEGRTITEAEAHQLWRMAREMDDWTTDTLLSCIAQAIDYIDKGRQSPDGLVWIDTDTILGNRGLAKKTKDGYSAGYKAEDRARVGQSMAVLEHLWVRLSGVDYIEHPTNGKKVKKHLPKVYNEGRLLAVMAHTMQEAFDGPGVPIAWGFTLGEPLKAFVSDPNRQVARLSLKALRYHETNERWERRLAIYCMIYMRVDAKHGATFRRKVGQILDDIGLTAEVDQRNPERTRQRLHKAMKRLVADGILGAWDYAVEDGLPARSWLKPWMDRVIIMGEARGSLVATEHNLIAERARRKRANTQRASATQGAKDGGKGAKGRNPRT